MFRVLSSLIVCLAVCVGLGCRRSASPEVEAEEDEGPAEVAFAPAKNADLASKEERALLVRDNTRFALDLHARLPRDGNLISSPFAVSTVLALAQAGAR